MKTIFHFPDGREVAMPGIVNMKNDQFTFKVTGQNDVEYSAIVKDVITENVFKNVDYERHITAVEVVPKDFAKDMFNKVMETVTLDHLLQMVDVGPFKIGKFPVTNQLWDFVEREGNFVDSGMCYLHPVVNVSWDEVQKWIKKLNKLTGLNYRLPYEHEWFFAAKGGNLSKDYVYAGSNDIDQVAWYSVNSGNKAHPVGQKKSNELGIYDMSGNVWEWCADKFKGVYRVYRGGSWLNLAESCRVANRFYDRPTLRFYYVGFRLAL